jgi:hypothetical protein
MPEIASPNSNTTRDGTPEELAKEKAREPLGVSAQRLVSRQCWVDWPAQPYLKPAQTI